MGTGTVLLAVSAAKLAVVTGAALAPISADLGALAHFWDAQQLYSLANSNLDVWLLALAQAAVLAALLSQAGAPRRRFSGLVIPPPYTKARRWGRRGSWDAVLVEAAVLSVTARRNAMLPFPCHPLPGVPRRLLELRRL